MDNKGIKRVVVGPLEVNCYLVWDGETREAACIDPGDNVERILDAAEGERINISRIVNTHGHFDHIGGNKALKSATGAPLAMHGDAIPTMEEAIKHGAMFGIAVTPSPQPDTILSDGDTIEIGSLTLTVIHTPGHSRGGISLYAPSLQTVFTGDTLFAGGIGRTDLTGGSYDQLIASIKEKLLPLDDETEVMPGHGDKSTIGREQTSNPFLAAC
ncbi:MAG: MBL fold metallo-hydrolase [Thermodesulfobacteriota bacterium]